MGGETGVIRIFVSSPGDAQFERTRIDRVVERLSGEFAGVARLRTVRWELEFYKAHETFQTQIPQAAECEIVIAILRHRLGTPLPADFPRMPDGDAYPSGTAYEILSSIASAKASGHPDVYVFRCSEPPTIQLGNDAENAVVIQQWEWLKQFTAKWFVSGQGQFKAAFHQYDTADDFEGKVESLLRKWLSEKALKASAVLWPPATKGSPFRGLASFGAKHAPVFFGRSRDTARAVDALKDAARSGTPFLLLVGPSGSGKSSLARAGIVPRLTAPGVVPSVDQWRVTTMRPGEAAAGPIASLAARLLDGEKDLDPGDEGRPFALPELKESEFGTPGALAGLLRHADETAARLIVGALDKAGETVRAGGGYDRPVRVDLLVVVDQIDELFGGAARHPDEFARLLGVLLATGRIWLMATLRADLYERFLKEPRLLELKTRGRSFDVSPPGTTELAEIVRGPAAAAGLIYETDAATGMTLDERLLRDAERPDMLPLLQFALDQLYRLQETVDGETQLTFAAYESFGGIDGAIDKAGEEAVASLSAAEAAALPRLLRLLVRQGHDPDAPAGGGGLTLRSVPVAEVERDQPLLRLTKALVAARIVVSANDANGGNVRLAHQRILESWHRARDAVRANADYYRMLNDLRGQFERWVTSGGHPSALIPKGRPLADARSLAKRFGSELDARLHGFAEASLRRQRLMLQTTRVVPLVLLAICLIFGSLPKGLLGDFKDHSFELLVTPSFMILYPLIALLLYASYAATSRRAISASVRSANAGMEPSYSTTLSRFALLAYLATLLTGVGVTLNAQYIRSVTNLPEQAVGWLFVASFPAVTAWVGALANFNYGLREYWWRAGTTRVHGPGNAALLLPALVALAVASGFLAERLVPLSAHGTAVLISLDGAVAFFVPPLLFGLVLVTAEWLGGGFSLPRASSVLVGTVVVWGLTLSAANLGWGTMSKQPEWQYLAAGVFGGATCASGLASILPTLQWFSRWTVATLCGLVAGIMPWVDHAHETGLTYPVWQGTFAAVLGFFLWRDRQHRDSNATFVQAKA